MKDDCLASKLLWFSLKSGIFHKLLPVADFCDVKKCVSERGLGGRMRQKTETGKEAECAKKRRLVKSVNLGACLIKSHGMRWHESESRFQKSIH